ncbi:MAG: hypothetical protein EHM40_00770 [Chloroflexi bacterium]|nr:MAG: hypothetical protein EHM40_00770 [Chloroflexota bacterium]
MRFRLLALLIFVLAACAPLPGDSAGPDMPVTSQPDNGMSTNEPFVNPFSPKPGDEKLTRGNVFINATSLVIRESYPPQISLSIGGDLPTPCHELRAEIASPDPENQIRVDVYSVSDPNVACVAVIKPFQEHIDLGTFPGGHYSVWVNGELAGEFDA